MVHLKIKITSIMEDGNGFTAEFVKEGKDWERYFRGISKYFGINPSMSIVIDGLKDTFKAKEGDEYDLYFKEGTIYMKKISINTKRVSS